MSPRRIYYLNYIDPKTGFLKREEFDTHRDQAARVTELKQIGILHVTTGSFEE